MDTVLGTYSYNGLGQRVAKTANSQTTQYRYGTDGALLAELDGSGTVVREYIYLNGQLLATLAVETVQAGGEEVILDNGDAGTTSTGTWGTKTSAQDYGIDYQLATKNSTPSTYRWTPTLTAGSYEVYAWWVSSGGYSNNVPYTIAHNGQTDVVNRSHKQNGGSWQLLGTWTFDGSGSEYIEVSNANGKASADAIKLVKEVTTTTQTNLYYVHNDHLGTPQAMTDDTGATVWRATYDPYGDASIDVASTTTLNVRFPGQYYDQETGLHYNYFRYYDPQTGRYITSDPIGLAGGINPYLYANANPSLFVDPYGLFGVDDVFGFIYDTTGGWSPGQSTVNIVAGFGDGISSLLTFGLYSTEDFRNDHGIDGGVDKCSASYRRSKFTGYAAGALTYGAVAASVTGWSVEANLYRHGGGGVNILRNGVRRFGADWHRFKLNGRWVNRPHYHRGASKSQMKKHRPYEGGF